MICEQPLWPSITMLVMYVLSLMVNIPRHGKIDPEPKDIRYNVVGTLLATTILYFGGFFDAIISKL